MRRRTRGSVAGRAVITHRFPIAEYQRAFDVMRSGQSGKVILDWGVA